MMTYNIAEEGVYNRLLHCQWTQPDCTLPDDLPTLKQFAKIVSTDVDMMVDFEKILKQFISHRQKPGRIYNPRLMEEWKKMKQLRKQKSLAGLAGNAKRWGSQRDRTAITEGIAKHRSSQSQSQSQSQSSSNPPKDSSKTKDKEKKENTPAVPSASAGVNGASAPVWTAYSEAYRVRYGVVPVRNAKVNGTLAQLVRRVGLEAAPGLAAWYCTHNGQLYVSTRHPTTLLLRDAEGLMTQWRTGTKATRQEAVQAEVKDDMQNQVQRVTALLKGGQP